MNAQTTRFPNRTLAATIKRGHSDLIYATLVLRGDTDQHVYGVRYLQLATSNELGRGRCTIGDDLTEASRPDGSY